MTGFINPFWFGSSPIGLPGVQVGNYLGASITGSLVPPMPSDVQEGDLLIMRIGNNGIDAATRLAGWTVGAEGSYIQIAYIVVGPTLPTHSQTMSGTRVVANITRYRLPATPTPVASTDGYNAGPTTTASAASMTIPGDASRVLVVASAVLYGGTGDVAPSTTFAAADMPELVPDGTHAVAGDELSLPSGRWLAEGAASGFRLGTGSSLHGFSVADTSPPATTGAFSNVFVPTGQTAMAAMAFKY